MKLKRKIQFIQPYGDMVLIKQNLFLWPSHCGWPLHPLSSCPPKRPSQPCQAKAAKRAKPNPNMEINPDDVMPEMGKKNPEALLPGLAAEASNSSEESASTNLPLLSACDDHWSWNPKDLSHEVRLSGPKHRIAHFHPNWSNGTAGVRGTRALNKGRYYWEINVSQRIFGTSMMFGVGTKKARLHVDAFVNMLGEDEQSWGLSHKGFLWHSGKHRQYTKPFRENVATTVGIFFDGIAGTVTYFKDGVSLGVAFNGLEDVSEPLYPVVCSTAAKTEMSLGVMKREFVSIQDRCRSVILRQLTHESQIEELELPRTLKQFILEGLSEDTQDDIALSQNNLNHHAFAS